jgi:hypothetical protein
MDALEKAVERAESESGIGRVSLDRTG